MDPHKLTYTYNSPGGGNIPGLLIIGAIVFAVVIFSCWPHILKWFNEKVRYRNNTIKSFIVCQKSPDIDLKKLCTVVDQTNSFLRGKVMKGIDIHRKKIKTKNLISITSIPGSGCYYFIIWYKVKG